MITYELARQLKDAGFHQRTTGERINPKGELEWSGCWDSENEGDYVHFPTLSELIEACREDFMSCGRYVHPKLHEHPFFAQGKLTHGKTQTHKAKSIEEAVARLWLAISE